MVFDPGTRVGPYEILSAIGVGGMGQVYRARDTRLKRDVALKFLPGSFAADADRLARFQREAEVLASLSHPSIAGIYGLEDSAGGPALVMELVEGETLADRLARGPIPPDEALPIARQICEALEAAHEQGIIHRDLKPANIKVTPNGHAKVLDFGLAKLNEPNGSNASDVSNALSMSPTITSPALMTGVGVLLGTAAYMSPEQAAGKSVDKRADLWAFGVVLFEMLAGHQMFAGETVSHVLASVLKDEPDWRALPSDTPSSVRRLLRRCLEKDRKQRLDSAAGARLEIDDALTKRADGLPGSVNLPVVAASRWRRALPWMVAAAMSAGLAVVLGLWAPWRTMPLSASQQLRVDLGVNASLSTDQGAAAVLSPDGNMLVFTARKPGVADSDPDLYTRRLDQLEATLLPGTEGAHNPFFSPDGQWVAFFGAGKLKKILVTGGAAATLCDAPNGRGGWWADDGTIVFTPNNTPQTRLLRVSSAGGTPQPVTMLASGEVTQRWPQVLPGGRAVLYSSGATTNTWESANIVVQLLPAGERKVILEKGYYARYLPSGHLVYVHEGTLFAAPFDLNRLELSGQPVPVLEGIIASPTVTGGGQFAFSSSGTAVYTPGEARDSNTVPIAWLGRDGKTAPLRSTAANWTGLLFSPDGSKLAMDISDGKQRDVWTYEWARETLSRLTFDPTDDANPVWTPDGRRIAFASKRGDKTYYNLYWQQADGGGEAQLLLASRNSHLIPGSWHPSGKYLAYHEIPQPTNSDLMILPMQGSDATGWSPGTATVFLKTSAGEQVPTFSPDGRWVAYFSDATGRNEVYVRPFPGPGGQWQISTGGGTYPTWSRARQELFYATLDGHIMVVPYRVEGETFRPDRPSVWTDTAFTAGQYRRYTLDPKSDRFAVGKRLEEEHSGTVVFLVNFFDELRRLAPVTKRSN